MQLHTSVAVVDSNRYSTTLCFDLVQTSDSVLPMMPATLHHHLWLTRSPAAFFAVAERPKVCCKARPSQPSVRHVRSTPAAVGLSFMHKLEGSHSTSTAFLDR